MHGYAPVELDAKAPKIEPFAKSQGRPVRYLATTTFLINLRVSSMKQLKIVAYLTGKGSLEFSG